SPPYPLPQAGEGTSIYPPPLAGEGREGARVSRQGSFGVPLSSNVLIRFRARRLCPRLRSARIALSRAVPGGGARHPGEFGLANGPSGSPIDNDRLGFHTGLRIHDGHARPFRGKMPVAEGEQGDQDRAEVASTLGRPVFVPRRM